jgi:hypothetical protein
MNRLLFFLTRVRKKRRVILLSYQLPTTTYTIRIAFVDVSQNGSE